MMRVLILIIVFHFIIQVDGQETSIRKLSENDFGQLSTESSKKLDFINYHRYNTSDGKYLFIDNQKIDLVTGEYLIKIEGDLILTEVTNESYSGPTIYKRNGNQRIKVIDLPSEGSIAKTNEGFLYKDFSHGQGCIYEFYSNEGQLLNTYKPYPCFGFGIERKTKDLIIIAAQESTASIETKLAILNHAGQLIKETTFATEKFGVQNMVLSTEKIYLLLPDKHPTQKLKVFDNQLNDVFEVNLGSVIRHQLSLQKGTIAYFTKTHLTVINSDSGDIKWKKDISGIKSYAVGNSRNKNAISVLLNAANGKKEVIEFDIQNGNELSRSEIEIERPYQSFYRIQETPNGCFIYNGKEIVELKTMKQ